LPDAQAFQLAVCPFWGDRDDYLSLYPEGLRENTPGYNIGYKQGQLNAMTGVPVLLVPMLQVPVLQVPKKQVPARRAPVQRVAEQRVAVPDGLSR
jgi:hypothetical protein